MAEQITDLYVLLRAENGQLLGGFAEAGLSGEEMAAKIAAVTAEVEAEVLRLNKSLVSIGSAADTAALESSVAFEKMALETRTLAVEMEAASVKAAASVETMGSKIDQATFKNTKAIGTVANVTAAISTAVVAITSKMAGDFESNTNRLVTSAGETEQNLGMVRQGILDMAGAVGDSSEELVKGAYAVESMGYHDAAALEALRAAAQGAKAENADLTTVAKGLTATMNDYGPKVGDAATVMSKLVTAVGDAGTTFEDFTGALHNILPIAAAMNVPFADITGALAEMTAHGMSADQASQNLANSLRSLQKPSIDQSAYLAQIGISASDLSDKLSTRGLTGTLEDIRTAIVDHMGPAGKVLISAFNQSKTASRDLQVMLDSMPASLRKLAQGMLDGSVNVGQYRTAIKALPVDQQGMASQFDALMNKANGFNNILRQGGPEAQSYTQAMQRATGTATSLNTALMLTGQNTAATNKAVQDITGSTKEADGSVKGWASIQGTFNQKMDDAKAAIGAVLIQIGTQFLPILSKLVGWLSDSAHWLGEHPTLLKALAIAIGIVTIAALAFAAAMVIVNIALYTNPIVLIVSAIVAAIVVVITVLTIIVVEIVTHWDQIAAFFVDLWDTISHAFNMAINWIIGILRDFIDWVSGIPGKIVDGISSLGAKIGQVAKDAWDSFIRFVSGGFTFALDYFKTFPQKSAYALGYLIGLIGKVAKDAFNGFINAVVDGFNNTMTWFSNLGPNIQNILSNAKDWLKTTGNNILTGLLNAITEKWHDLEAWWNNLGPSILNILSDAKNWLVNTGSNIINGISNGIHNAWTAVANWWSNLGPNIKGFLGDAGSWLYNVGRDAINGLWEGIKSLAGWIGDQISGLVSNLVSGVKAGFDSHSPSRVFHAIGEDLMHGLGNGIVARTGMVIDMAKRATGQIVDAASMDNFTVNGKFTGTPGAPAIATGIGVGASSSPPVTNININVQGNVRTTQQLVRDVQQEMARYGIRNFGNGATYTGFGAF